MTRAPSTSGLVPRHESGGGARRILPISGLVPESSSLRSTLRLGESKTISPSSSSRTPTARGETERLSVRRRSPNGLVPSLTRAAVLFAGTTRTATSCTFTFMRWLARRNASKAPSASMPCCAISTPLAWPITSRVATDSRSWPTSPMHSSRSERMESTTSIGTPGTVSLFWSISRLRTPAGVLSPGMGAPSRLLVTDILPSPHAPLVCLACPQHCVIHNPLSARRALNQAVCRR